MLASNRESGASDEPGEVGPAQALAQEHEAAEKAAAADRDDEPAGDAPAGEVTGPGTES